MVGSSDGVSRPPEREMRVQGVVGRANMLRPVEQGFAARRELAASHFASANVGQVALACEALD